jgi:hypothetical protein
MKKLNQKKDITVALDVLRASMPGYRGSPHYDSWSSTMDFTMVEAAVAGRASFQEGSRKGLNEK